MKRRKTVIVLYIFSAAMLLFTVIAHTFVFNVLRGRVSLPGKYIGTDLTMEDGQKFTVFRRLQVDNRNDHPKHAAISKVTFKFRNLSTAANKRLSIIPAPFLIGMKDFREKLWTLDENSNCFQGVYQWASEKAAKRYPETLIFKTMAKRSAPGTLSYEIIPDTDMSTYLLSISTNLGDD